MNATTETKPSELARDSASSRAVTLLERMADAGLELAQYASYAEIVGGVRRNRAQIREWCDKIYELHKERKRLRSNGGTETPPTKGK